MNRKQHIQKYFINTIVVFVILPMLAAGLIYLGYRQGSFTIYDWLYIEELPDYFSNYKIFNTSHLPEWLTYNLPDGLWLFSFTNSLLLLCMFYNKNRVYATLAFIIAGISEVLQVQCTRGTFDMLDMLSYSIAGILSFTLLNHKQYEKRKIS